MLIGISSLIVFLVIAILIYRKTLSALLALPIMALALSIIGGVPSDDIVNEIIGKGALKLNATYTTTMLGGVLAELLNRLGIAKSIVKLVAEFAGDNRFLLSMALTLITALLFSTLGGLGAVIMVGTIILPVMLSLGVATQTAGGLFLFGICLGGMFNIASWQLYMDVLNIPQEQIINFVSSFSLILLFIIILFLTVELQERKNILYCLVSGIIIAVSFAAINFMQRSGIAQPVISGTTNGIDLYRHYSIEGFFIVFCLLSIYAIYRSQRKLNDLPSIVFLTPFVALCLVLFFKWPFIPAFLAGIAYAVLASWRTGSVKILSQSIIEGITAVIPAVVLMIGIGMLITAVQHPSFAQHITPLLKDCIPKTPWQYVLIFTVLAPLSLYRGPLSIWGMGSGLVSLLQKTAILPGAAIMGMLLSVGQIQGICDPTNTHNVWIANYLGTNTQALLRKTLPYAWLAVVFGLTLACSLGYLSN